MNSPFEDDATKRFAELAEMLGYDDFATAEERAERADKGWDEKQFRLREDFMTDR